tara:strand:+ start:150287 stop:151018 length:732 start_codon:yes stop_codon:yes gene_type:complete
MLFAQTWQTQSTDTQIAVLELFTAEGCGLCPAAERWVTTFPEQGITDEQLIILGFHIDYLNDKKSWVDRFASPIFSDRQRQLAHLNLYQSIYTPEFVISGEIIHSWRKYVKEVVMAVNGFTPEAHIALNVTEDQNQLNVKTALKIDGIENRQFAVLYLAVTEDGIISKVSGGDNAGTTFHHQHLVRKWLGPFALNTKGETDISTEIKLDEDWNRNNLKLVAVVQNLNDGFVLQGLSLPLTNKE